jgi:hypothetical protein
VISNIIKNVKNSNSLLLFPFSFLQFHQTEEGRKKIALPLMLTFACLKKVDLINIRAGAGAGAASKIKPGAGAAST